MRIETAAVASVAIGVLFVSSCRDSPSTPEAVTGGPIWFVEGARAAGIDFEHRSGAERKRWLVELIGAGVVAADVNGDEHLDIFFVNGGEVTPPTRPELGNGLYLGNGKGAFVRAPDSDATQKGGFGFGATAADYDRDGDVDIFVCRLGPDLLLKNRGDGTFEDVTAAAGVSDGHWSSSAAFGDVDGDGWVDLFVVNYFAFDEAARTRQHCEWAGLAVPCGPKGERAEPDRLYRNRGDGTFEDVSNSAGILVEHPRYGLAIAMTDFDGDDDLDILVANDSTPNNLWENDGKGHFTDTALERGIALSSEGLAQAGMGIAVEDLDADGRFDALLTTFSRDYNTCFLQGADGSFEDRSDVAGLAQPTWRELGFGVISEDFDGDGALDAFFANGHVYPDVDKFPVDTSYRQKNQIFRNTGRARFEDRSATAGPGLAQAAVSRGAAAGDFDEDGRVDIVVNNLDGPPFLLWNRGDGRHHWIAVRLRGARSHFDRTGIGSLVTVRCGDRTWKREVRSGSSFASCCSTDLHFGLGTSAAVDEVTVTWPGGGKDVRKNPPVGAMLVVTRDKP